MEQEANPDVKALYQALSDEGKKLEQALSLLTGNSLVQRGKLENQNFILSKDGKRYRLPLEVRRSVLSDIVNLDKQKVDELLRY